MVISWFLWFGFFRFCHWKGLICELISSSTGWEITLKMCHENTYALSTLHNIFTRHIPALHPSCISQFPLKRPDPSATRARRFGHESETVRPRERDGRIETQMDRQCQNYYSIHWWGCKNNGIISKAIQNNICVSSDFFSEKVRATAKTKHKSEQTLA